MRDVNPPHRTNVAWSLAILEVDSALSTKNLGRIAQELSQRPAKEFEAQTVANATGAFACMDMLGDSNVLNWLNRNDNLPIDRTNLADARQFHDVLVTWRQSNDPMLQMPPLLKLITDGNWIEPLIGNRRNDFPSSQTHLNIARSLELLGCHCANEILTPLGFSVDILATTPSGLRVHIEVDGPTHFLSDNVTPTGRTLFKRRLLSKSLGTVRWINVSQYEQMSEVERQNELKRLLG